MVEGRPPYAMTTDPFDEHGETWFGSGLRAHLGIEPPVEEPEPRTPAAAVERVVVPEPGDADLLEERLAAVAARERRLREAEQELEERGRRLAEEEARVDRDRAELEARATAARLEGGAGVRDLIRDRAERETERLWRTIDEALEATFDDGRPDFHARLAAIKLLLGEAYGDKPAAEVLPPRDEQPEDELAARRAERFQ